MLVQLFLGPKLKKGKILFFFFEKIASANPSSFSFFFNLLNDVEATAFLSLVILIFVLFFDILFINSIISLVT